MPYCQGPGGWGSASRAAWRPGVRVAPHYCQNKNACVYADRKPASSLQPRDEKYSRKKPQPCSVHVRLHVRPHVRLQHAVSTAAVERRPRSATAAGPTQTERQAGRWHRRRSHSGILALVPRFFDPPSSPAARRHCIFLFLHGLQPPQTAFAFWVTATVRWAT